MYAEALKSLCPDRTTIETVVMTPVHGTTSVGQGLVNCTASKIIATGSFYNFFPTTERISNAVHMHSTRGWFVFRLYTSFLFSSFIIFLSLVHRVGTLVLAFFARPIIIVIITITKWIYAFFFLLNRNRQYYNSARRLFHHPRLRTRFI